MFREAQPIADRTSASFGDFFGRYLLVVLVGLCVIGAGLRLSKLGEKSLWGDELATIASAQGNSINPEAFALRGQSFDPPAPIAAKDYLAKATTPVSTEAFDCAPTIEALKQNVHPPLFFCLMHTVIHFWGFDEGPLRLPAALFGILCLPVFYFAVRRVSSTETAVLATALMTLSAYQVDHAQDARQYTLLTLIAVSSAWVMLRLTHPRTTPRERENILLWLLLALLTAAGLFTQYFYAPFALFTWLYPLRYRRVGSPAMSLASETPYSFIHVSRDPRNMSFLIKLALGGALVAAALATWLPVFRAQMAFNKTAGHFSDRLWNPVQLPEQLFRSLTAFVAPDSTVLKIVLLVVFGWALLTWVKSLGGKHAFKITPALQLGLWWLAMVVGGQLAIDVAQHSHTATVKRYLLLAAPGMYIVVAELLVKVWLPQRVERFRAALIGLVVLLTTMNAMKYLFIEHTSSDEFKKAANFIAERWQENDVVIINKSGAVAVGMAYYLPPETSMMGMNAQSSNDLQPGSPYVTQLKKAITGRKRVWITFSHEAPSTREWVTGWMMRQGYGVQMDSTEKFPGVYVQHYVLATGAMPD